MNRQEMTEKQTIGAPPKRVLIVDDEQGFREMLKWHLVGKGMLVETAENGVEAMRWLNQETFSLVITDFTMPSLNGIELIETLKQNGCKVPVIMVTGFGTVESAVYAMKKGANDFILKPFDLNRLMDVIGEVFQDGDSATRRTL